MSPYLGWLILVDERSVKIAALLTLSNRALVTARVLAMQELGPYSSEILLGLGAV